MCDVRRAEGQVSDCASRAGSGLWLCQESAGQHQDSEADPGGGHVAAKDVLESSSAQHRPLRAEPEKGSGHTLLFLLILFLFRKTVISTLQGK